MKPGLWLLLVLVLGSFAAALPGSADNFSSVAVEPASYALSGNFLSTAEQVDLIMRAEAEGSLRLIVGVSTVFLPEGMLSSQQVVEQQRQRIDAAQDRLLSRLSATGMHLVARFESIPYLAVEADADALEALLADPGVFSIEEDLPVPPSLAESVDWIGGDTAWSMGYTGAGQSVAILDTGVDNDHPFFEGRVVSEACYSTTYAGYSATSVCPGGVDSTAAESGENCDLGVYGCNHGTHVAGIAAGQNASYAGVAPDASIIAIQVFSRFDSSTNCGTSPVPCALSFTSDQLLGLERVYALRTTYNIASVNMSLGGGNYPANCDTDSRKAIIDNLRAAGIATVISAGNNSYRNAMGAPACISSAISVGSTLDYADEVSYFSNISAATSLLAPGSGITSSIPGTSYASFNGTSMAAPHVTGAWAVLKQKDPHASVTDLLAALISTGVSVLDQRSGGSVTKPRIQLDLALNAIAGPTPTPTFTHTAIPPTATFTNTPLPPTATFTHTAPPPTATAEPPTPTNTAEPPTPTEVPPTATNTALPPTATNTAPAPTPTDTPAPLPTNTPVPPTATNTLPAPTPTNTTQAPVPTATGTPPRLVSVTLRVTVPGYTHGTLYMTREVFPNGTLGDWDPAGAVLTQINDTLYAITFDVLEGNPVEYKITRGTWETVETAADGNTEIANRTFVADYGSSGTQIEQISVANWRDPQVTMHDPQGGANGVPLDAELIVTWSQAMPPDAQFSVTGPDGPVAGSFSYDDENWQLRFTPSQPLRPGSRYSIEVRDLADAAGEIQQEPVTFVFTTLYINYLPALQR